MDLIRAYRNGHVRYVRRPVDLWMVLGGLLVLVVCMFIVRSGEVDSVEEAVFHLINGLPDSLQAPMWLLQIPGILVFPLVVALAALTGLEFWVATAAGGSVAFLFIIALVKAGVIIQYYMHLESVWSEEGAHS